MLIYLFYEMIILGKTKSRLKFFSNSMNRILRTTKEKENGHLRFRLRIV